MNVFQFVFGGRKWMKATSYSSKLSSFFVDSYNHPGKEHHSDHLIITDYPSKIRQPKKSIRRTNTFQTKPWILAIYIYIPYFGINRFPDLWILAIYIAPYFHHPQIVKDIRPRHQAMLGRFPFWASNPRSLPCLTWKRLQWKTGAVEDGHSMHFERILYILVWPDLQKYKLYYQDMKELQSYQTVEIHPG